MNKFDYNLSSIEILKKYVRGDLNLRESEKQLNFNSTSGEIREDIADLAREFDVVVGLSELRSKQEIEKIEKKLRRKILTTIFRK